MTVIWCMIPEIWSATKFFVILNHFCPFTCLTTWKIKILKKWKKTGDIILLHICTMNDNHMMYGSWDMKCDWQNLLSFWTILSPFMPQQPEKSKFWTEKNTMDVIVIFHFGLFLPFYPLNFPEKWNFKKMKKATGDIIILHRCTKNHDHMVYCSWDMVCNGCNCYFFILGYFLPFYPVTAQKNKISKKWKKHLELS